MKSYIIPIQTSSGYRGYRYRDGKKGKQERYRIMFDTGKLIFNLRPERIPKI